MAIKQKNQKNQNSQNKNSQYLVEYVKDLQKINSQVNVDIPDNVSIDEVMEDPEQFAVDFVEATFMKHLPKYRKASKLGTKLAKRNMR